MHARRAIILRPSPLDPRHAAHDGAVRARELVALKNELEALRLEREAIDAAHSMPVTTGWAVIIVCVATVLMGLAHFKGNPVFAALGVMLIAGFAVVEVVRDRRRGAMLDSVQHRLNAIHDRMAELEGAFDHKPAGT